MSEQHSTDLAALLFARSILADPQNGELQVLFDAELANNRAQATPAVRTDHPLVMFAPGFLYRSHPETGSDFAIPRRHLTSLGISNRLIDTNESGSIEDNARSIATALRRQRGQRILIVSASKAGPEVALALGRLLSPSEATAVSAWINIGGLLGGSPLADQALHPSRRWLVRLALWWKNLELAGVRSLRTAESRRRLDSLHLPPGLPVINVVAVPLSGEVSQRAAGGYRKLRRLGPNDGLALLADQILPDSRTLLLLGDDHFLTRHDQRALTLALLAAARQVMNSEPVLPQLEQRSLPAAPPIIGRVASGRHLIALEPTFQQLLLQENP